MLKHCKNWLSKLTFWDYIVFISICISLAVFVTAGILWSKSQPSGQYYLTDLYVEACANHYQSPIDIRTNETVFNPSLKDFAIFFDPPLPGSKFYVYFNGYTIQVNIEGKFYVSNGGLENIYRTAQFHFHWGHKKSHGSEHTLDGEAAPLEMHIVNWDSEKYSTLSDAAIKPAGIAVLGILFEISSKDNPVLEAIVNVMSTFQGDVNANTDIPAVSMQSFLPRAPNRYYRYNGSLTTPGCFESVIWTVFHFKQTISKRQLRHFTEIFKRTDNRRKRSYSKSYNDGETGIEQMRFLRDVQDKTNTISRTHIDIVEEIPSINQSRSRNGIIKSREKKARKMLVNNYKPVQPLNGRIVYRSFEVFDESAVNNDTDVACLNFAVGSQT